MLAGKQILSEIRAENEAGFQPMVPPERVVWWCAAGQRSALPSTSPGVAARTWHVTCHAPIMLCPSVLASEPCVAGGPCGARARFPHVHAAVLDMSVAELEVADSGKELVYQPPTPAFHSTTSSARPQGKRRGTGDENDLAQLLDVWDRAVASRTYNLMSQLKSSQGTGTSAHHRKRGKVTSQKPRRQQPALKLLESLPTQSQPLPQHSTDGAAAGQPSPSHTSTFHPQTAYTSTTTTTTNSEEVPASVRLKPYKPRLQPAAPPQVVADGHPLPLLPRGPAQKEGYVLSVDDIIRVVSGSPPPHLQGKSLDHVVQQAPQLALHTVIKVLGKSGNTTDVERLLNAIVSAGRATTYTWGTSFLAFSDGGRFDLAIHHLERTFRQGVDVGPVGASSMVKVAAQHRNLDLALDLFYKMTAARVTFNRHVYNCIIHLCGVLGRIHDALDMLTHMRAEAESNAECRPDCYTYSALLYAISTSHRWEHLNNVFFSLLEEKIDVSFEVWCQLISGAGKARKGDWAEIYWKAYKSTSLPQVGVFNAYLWALSRSPDGQLDKALSIYQNMPNQGLRPDSYTYVALLSMIAKGHCELAVVERLLRDIRTHQLQLNTQLGTALLNAYKRVPELVTQHPPTVEVVLDRAERLMKDMRSRRLATSKTYSIYATLYILAGQSHVIPAILDDARHCGCDLDYECYHFLHTACAEVGLSNLSEQFRAQRDVLKRQDKQIKRRAKERMAVMARAAQQQQ